ncbi:TPA: spore gernimation protein [Candidatus Poribacteria bacterium]|nr:spore gernimation protein [Candidatus Poribacteria bacterium]
MSSATKFYKTIFISVIGFIVLFAIIFIPLYLLKFKREHKPTPSADLTTKITSRTNAPKFQKIRLYFLNSEKSELVAEERDIELSRDYIESIKQVINKLIEGSATGMLNPIPKGTKLREVFFEQKRGYVYVDFSEALSKSHIGGVTGELLTIQSIIKTLQANFHEIKEAQILIDGKDVDTIAGHIDISQPLSIE